MPGVNGHVVGSPALQASMSMLSLEPATRTFGLFASTASAGSFCLFCENGDGGLPTLTSVSGLNAPATAVRTSAATATSGTARSSRFILSPFLSPLLRGRIRIGAAVDVGVAERGRAVLLRGRAGARSPVHERLPVRVDRRAVRGVAGVVPDEDGE